MSEEEHAMEPWNSECGHREVGFQCLCGFRRRWTGEPSWEDAGRWHVTNPGSDLRAILMHPSAVAAMRRLAAGHQVQIAENYAEQLTMNGVLVEDTARRTRLDYYPILPLGLTEKAMAWLSERNEFDAWVLRYGSARSSVS